MAAELSTPGPLIDLPTAAGLIGFPRQKVWELVVAGVLPSIRAGRTFRVPRALFEEARRRGCTESLVLEDFAAEWAARGREEARDGR